MDLAAKARDLMDSGTRLLVVWRADYETYVDEMAKGYYSRSGIEQDEETYMVGTVPVGLETIAARREHDGMWIAAFTSEEQLRKWYKGTRVVEMLFADIAGFALHGAFPCRGVVIDPMGTSVQYPNDVLRAAREGGTLDAAEERRVKLRTVPLVTDRLQNIEMPRDGQLFEEELREAAHISNASESRKAKLAAASRHLERNGEVLLAYTGVFEDDTEEIVRSIAEHMLLGKDKPEEPLVHLRLCQMPAEDGTPQIVCFTQPAQVTRQVQREAPEQRYIPVPFESICRYIAGNDSLGFRLLVNPFNIDTLLRLPRRLSADGTLLLEVQDMKELLASSSSPEGEE